MKVTKVEKKVERRRTKEMEKILKVWSNATERINCKTEAGEAALSYAKYMIENISLNLKERKGAKGKTRWAKEIRTSYCIGIIDGMRVLLDRVDKEKEDKRIVKFLKAITAKIKGTLFEDILY